MLGSRAFLDVLYGNWYNFFPLRPVRDFGLYDGPWEAPRIDTATNILSPRGGNNGYQDQKRYKPQFYTTLSYFKDGWGGSHDLRAGFDWKRDRRSLFNDQPFEVQYRDNNAALAQVDIYNSSVTGINDVVYTAGWINDTFKVDQPPDLNVGVRVENYKDQWPDQSLTPNGIPALSRHDRPALWSRCSRRSTCRRGPLPTPRRSRRKFGFAYDLTGDNRTVIKGFIGQSRWNSADMLADLENPVGLAFLRYAFVSCSATVTTGCDINGDRLISSPAELGAYQHIRRRRRLRHASTATSTRPTSNEISLNLEREITTGLSGRASWVYKNMRNVWGEIDTARVDNYTVPFTINDPGADRVVGTGDDQTFQTRALRRRRRRHSRHDQSRQARQRRFPDHGVRAEPPLLRQVDDARLVRLHLVEDGAHRRCARTGTSSINAGGTIYRPFDRLFGDDGIETDTLWNYKVVGRYVLPYEIGFSGSWKVQSGFNYAADDQRHDAGRRRTHHPRRTDRREPLSDCRDPRLPSRQVGQLRQVRQGHADARRLQHHELGRARPRCARPTPRRRRSTT